MKDTTGNIKVFIISKLSLENRAVRWGRDPEQRQGDECVRRLMQYMVQGRDDVVWFRVK